MTGLWRDWRAALRLLGGVFLALGALALLGDVHITGGGLDYRPSALGEIWHQWHAPSLNLMQAVIERYVLPQLWSHALLPLLLSPAWIVAVIKGAICIGLSYARISAHSADRPAR